MKTEKMKLSELQLPERNVRKHPKQQIKELQRSIEQFGQIRPIIVDENNTVLAGNGLYMALQNLGIKQAVVLKKDELNEKQKKKLMIADNRIYDLGFDDQNTIMELLSELDGDYNVPGFDEELLEDLLSEDEDVEEILQDYGNLEKEDVKKIERNRERVQERSEEQPYISEEEYREEYKQAVEGETEQPEDDSNEFRESRKCPRCGGTGWL